MDAPMFDHGLLHGLDAPVQSFAAGEKIFLQDEPASCLYIVRRGKVQLVTFGTVLENVGPGGAFGEMAMIDSAPRSAAAIATEPTEVIALERPAFLALIGRDPEFALKIMSLLAKRIRRMNASL